MVFFKKSISPKTHSTSRALISGLLFTFAANILLYLGHLIIARYLSREDYATFTVIISFIALMALLADLGSVSLFVRKFTAAETLARMGKKDERGELLGSILALRFGLAIIVSILVIIISPILGYSEVTRHLMMIMLIILFISSRLPIFRSVGDAFLRGHNKYHLVAIFTIIDALVFTSMLYFYSSQTLTLENVVWIYGFCNLPGFLLLFGFLYRFAKSSGFHLSFSIDSLRSTVREGLPLIFSTTFLTIYNYADALLLDKLSTPQEVSAFAAGMRILSALIFLPLVFAAIISPPVTQAVIKNEFATIRSLIDRSLRLLIIFATLIALTVSSAPTLIIHFLFGGDKYIDAAPIVVLFSWAYIAMCFGTFMTEIAIAEGKLWISTLYMGVLMVFSITFDFIFIPKYGALGSAMAKTIAVSFGSVIILFFSKTLDVMDRSLFLRFIFKIVFIVLIVEALRSFLIFIGFHEVLIAALVFSVFLVLTFFSKAILFKEISSFMNGVFGKKRIILANPMEGKFLD